MANIRQTASLSATRRPSPVRSSMISSTGAGAVRLSRLAAARRRSKTFNIRAPTRMARALGTGYGKAINRNLAIFGRVGWVDRLTPIDEAAIYGDISRNWMVAGGYTEAAGPVNPYPATVQTGLDTLNVARVGGQYTHLFNGNIEVNVSAAVAYGFDSGSGICSQCLRLRHDFALPDRQFVLARIRRTRRLPAGGKMVLDAFLLGTAGGEIGKNAPRRHRASIPFLTRPEQESCRDGPNPSCRRALFCSCAA